MDAYALHVSKDEPSLHDTDEYSTETVSDSPSTSERYSLTFNLPVRRSETFSECAVAAHRCGLTRKFPDYADQRDILRDPPPSRSDVSRMATYRP